MDLNLPFRLSRTPACCQDVTSQIIRDLGRQGINILSYIDDFGGVVRDVDMAKQHFDLLSVDFKWLSLQEVKHKACPLA